ncbi:hypothetical protein HZC31_06070 [Candidatus Woesearchaeota archaeon]|nr:hypothetical protein [Candidatus Woesearchaeota archaeon]
MQEGITTLDAFQKWCGSFDCWDYKELQDLLRDGTLSLNNPLGVLLEVLRYEKETTGMILWQLWDKECVERYLGSFHEEAAELPLEFWEALQEYPDAIDSFNRSLEKSRYAENRVKYKETLHAQFKLEGSSVPDEYLKCLERCTHAVDVAKKHKETLYAQRKQWAPSVSDDDLEYLSKHVDVQIYEQFTAMRDKYGITAFSQGSLFQDSVRILETFISTWYETPRTDERVWNPSFAPDRERNPQIAAFCQANSPGAILREFDLSCKKDNFSIYPFDGWGLAECVRLSYESRVQK